jgi:hypothetical protein
MGRQDVDRLTADRTGRAEQGHATRRCVPCPAGVR